VHSLLGPVGDEDLVGGGRRAALRVAVGDRSRSAARPCAAKPKPGVWRVSWAAPLAAASEISGSGAGSAAVVRSRPRSVPNVLGGGAGPALAGSVSQLPAPAR
jgi:hypothetical protein